MVLAGGCLYQTVEPGYQGVCVGDKLDFAMTNSVEASAGVVLCGGHRRKAKRLTCFVRNTLAGMMWSSLMMIILSGSRNRPETPTGSGFAGFFDVSY